MQATLDRMGEKCDPYVYYTRVRLPMSGWRGNPALPEVWDAIYNRPILHPPFALLTGLERKPGTAGVWGCYMLSSLLYSYDLVY